MESLIYVGKNVKKADALPKVLGTARYAGDMRRPGMLVAKALFPTCAHGLIKRLDVSKAAALPGVAAVMTAKDLPGRNSYGAMVADKPVIAEEKVCYEGDPVAILAAVDEATALAALKLIEVEYEPLPTYDDPREAIKDDAFVIHPNHPTAERGNLLSTVRVNRGDPDKAFAEADIIIENDYETPMVDHAYIEPDVCIAEPDPDTGGITIISPAQAIFPNKRTLSGVLNIPQSKIRCISPIVGGGFGGKEDSSLDVSSVASVLALKTNRPVIYELKRDEIFRTTGKRHASYIHHKLGAKKDGTIVAVEAITYLNKGAYTSIGGANSDPECGRPPLWGVTQRTAMYAGGTYYVPNINAVSYSVFTNTTYGCAFRGFGAPQATFAMECQMEELARKLGMDSLEIRRKNMLKPGDCFTTGAAMRAERGMGLGQCFDILEDKMEWNKPFDHGTGPVKRGRGIAAFIYGTGVPFPSEGSSCFITLNHDGTVNLNVSSTEMGQGIATALAQVCAETLGCRVFDVFVSFSDSLNTPDSGPTVGSRSATLVGNAVRVGAETLTDRLKKVAAEMVHSDTREIEIRDNRVTVKDQPDVALDLSAVIGRAHATQVPLSTVGNWYPPRAGLSQVDGQGTGVHAYAFGAQGVEVEVDTETGEVTVTRSVYACDIGKAINPIIVEGQIEGASAQAIGWAIMEEHFTNKGRLSNASYHDFLIPTAMDLPDTECYIVECPNELGPYGAKGIGEPGIVPGAPAIRNAIWDAIGIAFNKIPITAVRIMETLDTEGKEL